MAWHWAFRHDVAGVLKFMSSKFGLVPLEIDKLKEGAYSELPRQGLLLLLGHLRAQTAPVSQPR